MVYEKKILKTFSIHFYVKNITIILKYLLLKEGIAFHLNKFDSPLSKYDCVPDLVKICLVVLENIGPTIFRQTDGQINAKKGDQKSSLVLSAQVS